MILTNSGFWIALGDKSDTNHSVAHAALRRWAPEGLAATWPVITEVTHMLHVRVGFHATLHFMEQVTRGICLLPTLPHNAVARMSALMHRYHDLPMDLADASLVVLAEQLGEARILSTDRRDFEIYRWGGTHSFTNLL